MVIQVTVEVTTITQEIYSVSVKPGEDIKSAEKDFYNGVKRNIIPVSRSTKILEDRTTDITEQFNEKKDNI